MSKWSAAIEHLRISLPLLAAILLEASIRNASYSNDSVWIFVQILLQLGFESLPLFVGHYLLSKSRGLIATGYWLITYIAFPATMHWGQGLYEPFANWSLFNIQYWVFVVIASGLYYLSQLLSTQSSVKGLKLLSDIFSLNGLVILGVVGWSLFVAGIFASNVDPLYNQPLQPRFNFPRIFADFPLFLYYLLQFLTLAGLVSVIYWVNRYILIRKVLASQGVIAFLFAITASVLVLTPLLASIALLLPIHIPTFTLLPSQNYNPFDSENYLFTSVLMFLCTPVVLAFERQQQDKQLLETEQRQTQTELQLLQQQINPHFLFNTLNNLYALTLTKADEAPDMVTRLAELLRYTVYQGEKSKVTLQMEIDYLENYLALQQMRTGSHCRVNSRWPDGAEEWQISPLLLIILVENAFKHGAEKLNVDSEIELNMTLAGNRMTLVCVNQFDSDINSQTGIGLENLQRRLALLYPQQHSFSTQQKGNSFVAELTLELSPC